MIPQRVKVKGLLCYRDEQTIDFDGNATLWMLSGLNGSGKSAIFDAVTFSLFGHHRGGVTGAVELINKDSDSLLVEFDFLLDNKLYRAKRTLKRDTKGGARGTQQLFRLAAGTGKKGKDDWEPVEGTHQAREFKEWVEEHVGLDYTTFTSSVLLLQGKAERLLDSKPEGRREVLAGIVDLGRYERLHQKADERRKGQEGEYKSLKARFEGLPLVLPLDVAEAKGRIAEADAARAAARAEVERLHGLEYQAREWQRLQGQLAQARGRWGRARQVLDEAAAIEQAVARLRELREVVPRLHEITVLRGQAHQAADLLKALARERERLSEQLSQKEHALKQAHARRDTLNGQIARDESRHREVSAKLRKTAAQLQSLGEAERQENELARLRQELAGLPADAGTLVALAREAFDRLEALARVVPALARFGERREQLGRAVGELADAQRHLEQLKARGEGLKAEAEKLKPELAEAARVAQEAGDRATEARTLLQQARESLRELQQLDGAKVCRHCGQQLTPGHIDEEKRRRGLAAKEAEAKARQATAALEMARRAEQSLRDALARAEKATEEAREAYRASHGDLKALRVTVDRCREDCATIYAELPEALRSKISPRPVADWHDTAYPRPADLEQLRAEAHGLEPARRRLREAEQVQGRLGQLKAQEATTLDNLNRMLRDLPADRQGLRQEHADLEATEKALFGSLDGCRLQVKEAEREAQQLARERDAARDALGQAATRIKEQELVQQNGERGVAGQLKLLPPSWHAEAEAVGMERLHRLRSEQKELEDRGTEESGRELDQARHHVQQLARDVGDLEAQEAGFPAEARQELEVLAGWLHEAKRRDALCDEALAQARQRLATLEDQQRQRDEADQAVRALEKELTVSRALAELLGRERLQLFLVRQAERQVVEYANAVLDRLSGGQLYLKLSGEANGEGASAKALELEAFNRATGERPINVAFLSGSQKFRVAVALALGIGQYASRQHRPIESVIIDEGFGCLDSQGRQVMIQELQNLRSQMRCILLVSHQEDFAESFSDGYQFRLENGATRVTRFQK